jgi:hypothetical protein
MDLTKLTAKEFGRIVKLLRRKESLEKKLTQVERSVAKVVGAGASFVARRAKRIASGRGRRGRPPGRRGRPAGRRSTGRKFGRRGGLRKVVLTQLQRAGVAGLKIKDLARKMNIQRQRLDTWFYQNVKKIRGLKKIGPGHYHLRK